MGLIKLQLGRNKSPQRNFSKSILQKDNPIIIEKQLQYEEAEHLNTTFNTGFVNIEEPVKKQTQIEFIYDLPKEDIIIEHKKEFIYTIPEYKEIGSILESVKTGFTEQDKPILETTSTEFIQSLKLHKDEDSILGSVETGFDSTNSIHKVCPKPEFKTHLFKDNYLNEFQGATEKALVRYNLEVFSKSEVKDLISHVISDGTSTFVSKEEVQDMIDQINFVDSSISTYASYDIPNTLFPL